MSNLIKTNLRLGFFIEIYIEYESFDVTIP